MPLTFSSISSPGAARDLFVDLTGALEDDEFLSLATVTSACPDVLVVSDVAINSEVVTVSEQEIGVGKGVHFSVETQQESHARVPLIASFEGDSGTAGNYELVLPIVPRLSE